MKKALELFLGILTAVGGFVEIGELTFSLNAGSKFGFSLLWVLALGTIGIVVYCEMAGRIAAVRKQPVFHLIRERAGFTAGLVTLLAANLVNLLTCAAEIGGIALVWQTLGGWPYRPLILLAFALLALVIWFFPFEWIERVFGLLGLLLVVFVAAAIASRPDWGAVAQGFVPQMPAATDSSQTLLFAFFAVALFSSIVMPYETYFYASGAIEDKWTTKDINLNRIIVIVGSVLGSLLAVALVILGSEQFAARDIDSQLPGTAALAASIPLGRWALLAALVGMLFAFGGAAIETTLSSAYNLAQFFGWPWGKFRQPREAGRFHVAWLVLLLLSTLLIVSGADPVDVVEYSIVLAVVTLPFTYFPMLVIAADKRVMKDCANGWFANAMGWFFLVLTTLAGLAAIPLLLITHGGRG
ncbi:MAG TPA: divalent metal cation transporter [Caldimonas sp.]|nr:divalent metal cation transporter [Caldimonas sp.]HEV7577437.1 divalent metal cation transporter [Caldimonas sp.]